MNTKKDSTEDIVHTELTIHFMWINMTMPLKFRTEDVEKAVSLLKNWDIKGLEALAIPTVFEQALRDAHSKAVSESN